MSQYCLCRGHFPQKIPINNGSDTEKAIFYGSVLRKMTSANTSSCILCASGKYSTEPAEKLQMSFCISVFLYHRSPVSERKCLKWQLSFYRKCLKWQLSSCKISCRCFSVSEICIRAISYRSLLRKERHLQLILQKDNLLYQRSVSKPLVIHLLSGSPFRKLFVFAEVIFLKRDL